MTPSFFKSTLSLAFVLCLLTIIIVMVAGVAVSDKLLAVLTGVISAYLAVRIPSNPTNTGV